MKPKNILIMLIALLMLSGCVNVEDESFTTIINESVNSTKKITNTYRRGYKFYLPKGLYITDNTEYNEVIKSKTNTYYLYVDVIGYLNKNENTYKENKNAFYSKLISANNKDGYIEINTKNDKYLVEIVYNYAKIEVMVTEDMMHKVVSDAIVILSSIEYNDNVLASTRDTVLDYNEKDIDIFKTHGKEKSNFLQYVEYDEYDDTDVVPDYDIIK